MYKRQFYTYTVDAKGNVTLTAKAENSGLGCYYGRPSMIQTANYWKLTAGGHTAKVYDDVKVLDLRTTNYGKVTTVEELYQSYYTNGVLHNDANLTVAYTVDGKGNVNYIYVVDEGWASTVTVNMTPVLSNLNWKVVGGPFIDTKNQTVTVTLHNDYVKLDSNSQYTVKATAGNATITNKCQVNKDGDLVVVMSPDWSILERDVDITLDIADLEDVTFADTATVNSVAYTVETNADDSVMELGTPVNVTVSRNDNFRTNSTLKLQFTGNNGDVLTAYAELGATAVNEVTVTVYPINWSTYTLTYVDYVTE